MRTSWPWLCLLFVAPSLASATDGVRVRIGDRPVGPSADPASVAAEIAEQLAETPVIVSVLGRPIERPWSELGAQVDRGRLTRWLTAALDPDSPMREEADGEIRLRVPTDLDTPAAMAWLVALKRENDRPARDARVDVATGEVHPEQEGHAIDVWATFDAMDRALAAGEDHFEVQVVRTPAHRTADELRGMRIDGLLGEFDTHYNGTEEARDRTHNLRMIATKVDGVVLLPGETFDFNEVVGERSLAAGFKPAPVIAGGELVDGVGGGACQIAGTLHAAAFFAGLGIIERHPHSRPSSYIKLGLDAAVAYPNINFRMRNDRDEPVLIRITVTGGITRAEIRGGDREHLVRFVRRVDDFEAFDEREVEDSSLPTGVRVLSQRGVPGFSLTRFRVLHEVATNQFVRQRSEDAYPPTTQIWRVGTGGARPADYVVPTGDQHSEYRADVYTVVSQGPGVEGTDTVRRAGRTGEAGWTVREGMPGVE